MGRRYCPPRSSWARWTPAAPASVMPLTEVQMSVLGFSAAVVLATVGGRGGRRRMRCICYGVSTLISAQSTQPSHPCSVRTLRMSWPFSTLTSGERILSLSPIRSRAIVPSKHFPCSINEHLFSRVAYPTAAVAYGTAGFGRMVSSCSAGTSGAILGFFSTLARIPFAQPYCGCAAACLGGGGAMRASQDVLQRN
jgi:hypothetical protein